MSKFIMNDCTDDILAIQEPFNLDTESLSDLPVDEHDVIISKNALKKRPDLREAVSSALDPDNKILKPDDELSDAAILTLINSDPKIRSELVPLFYDIEQCEDNEGNPTYRPSITDISCYNEYLTIKKLTGFREEYDETLPHKYRNLSADTLKILYSNPDVRLIVSRMNEESITDKIVRSMCSS